MNYKTSKTLNNEQEIYRFCFGDLINNKYHGYGSKRITLKVPNTISCKIPCQGFGFKDKDNILYLGVRLYIDQGDYVKFQKYNNKYSIYEHFHNLVLEFDKQYPSYK